jgi:hypothetical protein
MSTEMLKEPDGVVADFHVKLQSDTTPPSTGDPGRSLLSEVRDLRSQVAELCKAVRGLVQLQSIANQKLDAALKGSPNFEVL